MSGAADLPRRTRTCGHEGASASASPSPHTQFAALLRPTPDGTPPLLLAPMAGFTNSVTRRLAHRYGARLTYTEMVNAAGLIHDSEKTWQLLETLPDEGPVVAHLYGTAPASFAEAARLIAATGRFCAIDINAGCPVPRITRSGAGARLMRQPRLAGRIVAAIRAACDLPVTVKTRLGPHPREIAVFDFLKAIEEAGATALALHGRFTTQGHAGTVHLPLVAEVRSRARIPIIGNGGISDAASARHFIKETGVAALMIGKAAIGRPWIFRDVAAGLADPDAPAADGRPDLDELRAVLFEHLADEVERLRAIAAKYPLPADALDPEAATVIGFRCHFFRYLGGLKGVSWARSQLSQLRTLEQVRELVDACLAREAAYRARGELLKGSRNADG